jgi:hypothetical protein
MGVSFVARRILWSLWRFGTLYTPFLCCDYGFLLSLYMSARRAGLGRAKHEPPLSNKKSIVSEKYGFDKHLRVECDVQ